MAPGTGSAAGDSAPAHAAGEPGRDDPARQHYRVTFAVLAVGTLAYTLMQSMVLPALDTIQHDLHTSQADVAWLLSAFLLSASVATPVLGRMGDMFGKEKMLVVTFSILAFGTVVGGLASTLWLLILARVLQGVAGAVFPLAFSIIRDEFPEDKVAGGIGLISTLLGIGSGVGIIIGGPVVQHLSYHWLFWIPLVLVLAALVATIWFVPESPVKAPGRVDVPGGLLLSGWLVALLVAVTEGPNWGWGSPEVVGLFVGFVVLLVAWVWFESRTAQPLVDMRLMRKPTVWWTNIAGFLFGAGMYSIIIVLPPFVETPSHLGYGFGASPSIAGLYVAPTAGAMFVAGLLSGRISAAIGSKAALGDRRGDGCGVLRAAGPHPRPTLGGARGGCHRRLRRGSRLLGHDQPRGRRRPGHRHGRGHRDERQYPDDRGCDRQPADRDHPVGRCAGERFLIGGELRRRPHRPVRLVPARHTCGAGRTRQPCGTIHRQRPRRLTDADPGGAG